MGSRAWRSPQPSHVKGQQHLCCLPALRALCQQNPKEKPMGTSLLTGLWQKAVLLCCKLIAAARRRSEHQPVASRKVQAIKL